MIYFVGAGSGAPDLITVRGARLLSEADVIVYAGSLVNPALLDYKKDGCEVYNSAKMTLEEVIAVMAPAAKAGKTVVRLHTGDPCVYGAHREQMDELDKLGVGYDVLKEVNDQIIYAAVSGFGCYGPKHQRPGYDIIAQATSGLMSITGEAGGQPLRVGNAMGDVLGGMNLTIGILMALNARTVTGRGQRVDVALVDSVVSSLEVGWQRFFASGKQPELIGNRYASAFPYDSFQASDGRFVIGCGNDKLFTLLCTKALDRADLLEDPRFDTNIHRCENYAALKPEIEKWSSQHTIADCVAIIDAAGVPVAPINMLADVVNDDHIANAREMFVHLQHPVIGDMIVPGNPVKLMDTKPEITKCAPDLGQDNKEIYEGVLGLSDADLARLKEEKVI